MDGWICLHRKIRGNPIFNNLELFRLWLICLTEATHREHDQLVGQQMVKLMPGQFVTGRFDLEKMYNDGLPKDQERSGLTIWRWLQKLEKYEFLNINSNNKFTVVSILNWDKYQNPEHQNEQQLNNKRTTTEQEVNTNNNVNNDNNDNNVNKKKNSRKQVYSDDSQEYKMAVYFYMKICEWTDKVAIPDFQKWADDCRKILVLDKHDKAVVRNVIDWATKDSFWQTNILCPAKLRKQFTRLQIEMERKSKPTGGEVNGRTSAGDGGNVVPIVPGQPKKLSQFIRRA